MDRLWSPWRLEYVTGSRKDAGCVFCLPVDAQPADAAARRSEGAPPPAADTSLIVFQGRTAYVVLNLYPYNNGHLLVVPYRHVATLGALDPDELAEVAQLVQLSEAALVEAYDPNGLNVGINLGKAAGAGILEHLHVHLVPRWGGDTNFMTVTGDTRVLPEDLRSTAERLRPVFQRLKKGLRPGP